MTNIYVARLDYGVTQQELRALFAQYGTVTKASVVTDKDTGTSKGFGFIEMENDAEAQKAISELNGFTVNNREIVVKQAEDRPAGERKPFVPGEKRPFTPAGERKPYTPGGFNRDQSTTTYKPDGTVKKVFTDAPKQADPKKKIEPKLKTAADGKKGTKMEAYKKSGKSRVEDDDDDDFDYSNAKSFYEEDLDDDDDDN
jgi:RNA recognition motif-containing protein